MELKALNYLSLARKGGMAELGEEPVGAAARALKAHLILVAADASDHTWRRAKFFAAGTDQQCIRLNCTKDQMGLVTGRQSLAIAAITDVQLALAFLEALSIGQSEKYEASLAVLRTKVERLKKRQAEAKAHQRNVRKGKKK